METFCVCDIHRKGDCSHRSRFTNGKNQARPPSVDETQNHFIIDRSVVSTAYPATSSDVFSARERKIANCGPIFEELCKRRHQGVFRKRWVGWWGVFRGFLLMDDHILTSFSTAYCRAVGNDSLVLQECDVKKLRVCILASRANGNLAFSLQQRSAQINR